MTALKNLTYNLILNQKIFEIPSGFRFINDADPFICAELIKNKKYIVKSNVNEDILKSFINYWVYKETPTFNQENILQYEELSQEFDLMKDLIEIYKNFDSVNSDLSNQNQLYKTTIGNNEKEIDEKEAKKKELFHFLFDLKNDIDDMLDEKEDFILILHDVEYNIPSKFRYLNDVNPDIYNILREEKRYIVKTDASYDTFESFIDYWILKKIPDFNDENISEFEELSNEFDLMKDLITIYKNKKDEQKIFDEKSNKYNQIIEMLCEKHVFEEKEPFLNFKEELLNACVNGNAKYLDFFLQKKVYQDGLIFALNENNKTSAIIRCHDAKGDIVIPYSIKNQSQEYIVTKIISESFQYNENINSIQFEDNSAILEIDENAFSSSFLTKIMLPSKLSKLSQNVFDDCSELKSIDFQAQSELKIIDKNAFNLSELESIFIPASVTDLVEGWCNNTDYLFNIVIDEKNECFKYIEDSMIIGKSNKDKENYDVLCFVRRDIEQIIIPSYIKRISSYAFCGCTRLKNIEFQENSELESIGEYSFCNTIIENISIPSSVKKIEKKAFFICENLKKVDFGENSELISFGKKVFSNTSVKTILIPSHISQINLDIFKGCKNIGVVEFAENSELTSLSYNGNCDDDDEDDEYVYELSIEKIIFPPLLTRIEDNLFNHHYNKYRNALKIVEFFPNSKLKLIGKESFCNTSIESILIPSHVSKIDTKAFCDCNNLRIVEFMENSHLKLIEKEAFSNTLIETIIIPSHVTKIEDRAFFNCDKLRIIEFMDNSELDLIGEEAFSKTMIESILIPAHVSIIKKYAFANNLELKYVDITKNINLETIGDYSFSNTQIEKIIIPSQVKRILDGAFCGCKNLKQIEFAINSELEIIGKNSFSNNPIESIFIPAHVKIINEKCFSQCNSLKKIEFAKNTELKIIDKKAFNLSGLESIFIPASVTDLVEGWCRNTDHLFNVVIDENNECFKYIEDSTIIGKSNKDKENYDVLCFVRRDIEQIIIPSYIKQISACAFCGCTRLKNIEFQENSELESIGEYSFYNTIIENISIPSSVKEIKKDVFQIAYI